MTHELVHILFPSLPDDEHWMEEGLATYIEPLARVMIGDLQARQMWNDKMRDMHQGEPQPGDQGLNRTHTWGRTHWGGACSAWWPTLTFASRRTTAWACAMRCARS